MKFSQKQTRKKTELLNAYESYFKDLESVLKKIQTGLSILKTNASNYQTSSNS